MARMTKREADEFRERIRSVLAEPTHWRGFEDQRDWLKKLLRREDNYYTAAERDAAKPDLAHRDPRARQRARVGRGPPRRPCVVAGRPLAARGRRYDGRVAPRAGNACVLGAFRYPAGIMRASIAWRRSGYSRRGA